jgi:hypothetical protein
MTVDECRKECIRILREEYPKIKDGVFRLEVFMQTKSKKAVYELRDCFDHIATLHKDGITEEEANLHLNECRTHLRRCVVEPLEYMAEKQFFQLHKYVQRFGWIRFIKDNPLSKPDFFHKMKKIKELIAEGRTSKTEGNAAQIFGEAFNESHALLSEITPLRYLINGVLVVVGAFISGGLAAICANHLFK